MSKKLLSLFLAVVMLALAIPAAVLPAFAAEEETPAELVKESWTAKEYTMNSLHLGNTKWDASAYFLVWYNAAGTALADGAAISDTDLLKINPVLIEKEIISEDDTVQTAFAKWKTYMMENSTISFTGAWTAGNVDANGGYKVAVNETYLNGLPSFNMQSGKVRLAWDTNLLVADAALVAKQYDRMYSAITAVVESSKGVTEVALKKSQVNETANSAYTYADSAFMLQSATGLRFNPGGNNSRRNGLQWTSSYTGYASITVDNIHWNSGSTLTTMFSVLFNGTQVAGPIELKYTEDPTAAAQAIVDELEIGVFPGDTITLVFGIGTSSRPTITVSASVEVDTTRKPPEVWSGSEYNATIETIKDSTNAFFVWQDGAVTVNTGATLPSTAVCVVNPALVSAGIIAADDTVKEAFDKWTAYLKESAKITYNNAWEIHNYGGGKFVLLEYYNYYNNRSIFRINADRNKVTGLENAYWTTEAGINNIISGMWSCVLKSLSGTEKIGDVALKTSEVYTGVVTPHTYTQSALMEGTAFTITPGTTPNGGREAAYTWTSHGVGVAQFDVQSISGNGTLQFNVLLNGKAQMADYVKIDLTAANAAEQMNEIISALEIPVFEGDKVSIVFARVSGGQTVKAVIKGGLDDSRFPVVYRKNGENLGTFIAKLGDPIPELINAPDFGVFGYRINDEFYATLPETVTGPMIIESYQLKTSANITITSKYAINVFVEGGEGVIGAGVLVNGKMMDGEKQADGTYKVVVASVNANALRTASVTYVPYQIHEDGHHIDRYEKTVTALNLLNAYVNGDYDQTTKDLAQSVLDFTIALNAFQNGIDASAEVKLRLRGEPTIPGVSLSGKNEIYLGTLKQISTGEVPKYISANQDQVFVADPTVTDADKVKIGYAEGVDPLASEYKFAIKAVTLNMEERIGFAFRVVANGRNSVSELREGGVYKLRSFDGKRYAYYDAFLYEGSDKSAKAIVVDGVPASRYYQDYEFDIVEEQADGTYKAVSATMTYSVKAYSVQTYRFGDWGYKPMLAQALFRLCVYAQAYAEAHPVA